MYIKKLFAVLFINFRAWLLSWRRSWMQLAVRRLHMKEIPPALRQLHRAMRS